jgi:hypothetical protein
MVISMLYKSRNRKFRRIAKPTKNWLCSNFCNHHNDDQKKDIFARPYFRPLHGKKCKKLNSDPVGESFM